MARWLTCAALAVALGSAAAYARPAQSAAGQTAGWELVADGERTVLRLGGAPFRATRDPVLEAREVRVPGSAARIYLWSERASGGAITPWCAVSLDGRTVQRARAAAYRLELEHGAFDPLAGEPPVAPLLRADPASALRLVQLVAPPFEDLRRGLERAGARVLAYVAGQSYVVRLPDGAGAEADLAALPYVRWVGAYHPAYRLERELRAALERGEALPERAYNVLLFEKGEAGKAAAGARIAALGGRLQNPDAGARLIEAVLGSAELAAVASLDEVLFVDRWSAPEDDMDLAREISGGNYFHDVLGMRGAGVRGEVMDGGLRQTHADFTPPPLIHGGPPGMSQHGTNTYGIVFGDGVSCIGGALPEGTGVAADYGALLTSRYNHTGELVDPLGPYRCVFQSNSWGSSLTSSYTSISADMDDMLFDHDILIFQSQSNAGTTSSRPQAWAKNIVSVGGIRHLNTLSTADDTWTGGASTGPASDGRIKPDLAHHYDSIATTDSSTDTDCMADFCCTSAATPITAGHAGLWFELWHSGALGNAPGATVFDSRPHMTLSKAMLIAHAEPWTFSGATHDLGRFHQGWGRVNVRAIHDHRFKLFWVDESDVLAPFASAAYVLPVEAGEPDLRVVLTWADPPGNPAVQTQHRVNDLDLKLTAPDGRTFWGNMGLGAEMWSVPLGAPNDKDTVECVFVAHPLAGTWTVEVFASEVNQDGHVETPELDADFALVASGVRAFGPAGAFCDASDDAHRACPCANPGAPDSGCENSGGTGGVHAEVTTFEPRSPLAVVTCTGFPPAGAPAALLLRSSAIAAAPVPFGDGVLCVDVPVVRLAATIALGGTSVHVVGHGAGPGTFHYQAWYRNTPAGYCTPDAFNLSNGVTIEWP